MGFPAITALFLAGLWALTLVGFGILLVLYYPFSKRKKFIEWRKICSWEDEEQ